MTTFERVRRLSGKLVPIGLIAASTLVGVLLSELGLRFALNSGDFLFATMLEDPMLNHRIAPNSPGHDQLGFRNTHRPAQADIVAIGDSMTYGVSASREGSWPHQFSQLLQKPVYNMGLGGYGPLQYFYLADNEARTLKAKLIVVAFYLGNDLVDAYRVAHHTPYWQDWREAGTAQEQEAEYLRSVEAQPTKRFAELRDWLSRHSILYSVIRVTLLPRIALWEQDRIASQVDTDRQMLWSDPSNAAVRTIFTPHGTFSAMDQRTPIPRQGLRIAKRAFASMQNSADAQGARLLVVFIPTKERVYCRYLKELGESLSESFLKLCELEERIKDELIRSFEKTKIVHLDVTADMEAQTLGHAEIYPKDADGHPVARGYGVIARAIHEAIRAR